MQFHLILSSLLLRPRLAIKRLFQHPHQHDQLLQTKNTRKCYTLALDVLHLTLQQGEEGVGTLMSLFYVLDWRVYSLQ